MRNLMIAGIYLMCVMAARADLVVEPPKKTVLTGTVVWIYSKNPDGTKTKQNLALDIGKRKVSLINYRAKRVRDANGKTKRSWKWTIKGGKTVDFEALVGKKLKVTAMATSGSWINSIMSVEEVSNTSAKSAVPVGISTPNEPTGLLPIVLICLGGGIVAAGAAFSLHKMRGQVPTQ